MEVVTVKTWQEFREFVASDQWICPTYWRGQRDPTWPLASTFERTLLSLNGGWKPGAPMVYPYGGRYKRDGKRVWTETFYHRWRDDLLRTFRHLAQGRRGPAPAPLTEDQWWALARHYGSISPLLDWTERPYIAAFFALAEVADHLVETHRGTLTMTGQPCAIYRLANNGTLEGDGLRVVTVLIDELSHLHRQHGAFTFLDSEEYFELQGFLDNTKRGDLLTQILLPDHALRDALRDLHQHGIDYSTLFPDLHGAALHANWAIRHSSLLA
jgi:hypothetical protein